MTDIQKLLDRAYNILSLIPVSGDAVEKMCAVRADLREAYAKLNKEGEKEDG